MCLARQANSLGRLLEKNSHTKVISIMDLLLFRLKRGCDRNYRLHKLAIFPSHLLSSWQFFDTEISIRHWFPRKAKARSQPRLIKPSTRVRARALPRLYPLCRAENPQRRVAYTHIYGMANSDASATYRRRCSLMQCAFEPAAASVRFTRAMYITRNKAPARRDPYKYHQRVPPLWGVCQCVCVCVCVCACVRGHTCGVFALQIGRGGQEDFDGGRARGVDGLEEEE